MKNLACLVFATSLLAFIGTPSAEAVVLYTPPLEMTLDGGSGTCHVANVASKSVVARVRAYNSGGGVAVDSGEVTIMPTRAHTIYMALGIDGDDQIYCRFDVNAGKRTVRASACIRNDGDRLACLEAH